MAYLSEPVPPYGVPSEVAPGVRRVVARNPGLMTYHGTNTYLIDLPEGVVVLDPGPDDPVHVEAVVKATGPRVLAILLTHTHKDHLGGTAALKAATGAPTYAFTTSASPDFTPDVPLADGDEAFGLLALHTPGHAADHLCFADASGLLFSGDHVMSWSSSVVSPPQGDMSAYCANLRRLMAREDSLYLPGHGPPLAEPRAFVADLLFHREEREKSILAMLHAGTSDPVRLAEILYAKRDVKLMPAAQRNVLAHLLKLKDEGRARTENEAWLPA